MQTARSAIVGAGPAGLTAALVAKKLALETLVFEQAPDFQRIGGGIALQSNGLRVLDALDLLESFRPAMRLSEVAVVELPGGRRLGVYDGRKLSIPQNHLAVVLRYRLQEHLLAAAQGQAIRIEFDRRCTAARIEGGQAVLRFADGREEECDIVIGADGINSSIRESLGLRATRKATDHAYLRGVGQIRTEESVVREIWGPDGHRFGICPLPSDQTYFYCSVSAAKWPEIRNRHLDEWIDGWRKCGPDPVAILQAVPDWGRVNYDEPSEIRLARWYRLPFFLIGDAAHAMTPDLGQGANSAMVDSLVLMQLLARALSTESDLGLVGSTFESLRKPFIRRTQSVSRLIGRSAGWSSAPARLARDLLMRAASNVALLRRPLMYLAAGYNPDEEPYFHLR